MADLISKFFKTELTEQEDQELSRVLLDSTEDSKRFVEEAESAYARYGLPEPKWPGDPHDFPRPQSGGRTGLWLAVGLVGLAAWAAWHYHSCLSSSLSTLDWHRFLPINEETPQPKTIPLSGKTILQPKAVVPGEATEDLTPGSEEDNPADEVDRNISPGGSQQVPTGLAQNHTTPFAAPADPALAAKPSHDSIEVVVRRAAPGLVTVQVLDGQGSPLLLLYRGTLREGSWAFDWNGRLADGQAAGPGRYQIQVQSGGRIQTKNVLIR